MESVVSPEPIMAINPWLGIPFPPTPMYRPVNRKAREIKAEDPQKVTQAMALRALHLKLITKPSFWRLFTSSSMVKGPENRKILI